MITEMYQLLEDEEQGASGEPSRWPDVYKLMERSCGQSPHCWINPEGEKHIRPTAIQLRELADLVNYRGGTV